MAGSSHDAAARPATPALRLAPPLAAALGGGLTVYLLAEAQALSGLALLAPSFGASCVLVFALPESPLAQPRNVIGGHLVSTAVGLLVAAFLGTGPAAMGLAVGLAIAAMLSTRTTHPPAGGDPLMVILSGAPAGFLFKPILLGAIGVVLIGFAYHRLVTRRAYPAAKQSGALARSQPRS